MKYSLIFKSVDCEYIIGKFNSRELAIKESLQHIHLIMNGDNFEHFIILYNNEYTATISDKYITYIVAGFNNASVLTKDRL